LANDLILGQGSGHTPHWRGKPGCIAVQVDEPGRARSTTSLQASQASSVEPRGARDGMAATREGR
jgi:hypothetical protein